MSRYTKLLAIVLVVLAAILGFVAYRLAMAPKPAAPAPLAVESRPAEMQGPRFDVVVAAAAVEAGTPLKASDLTVAQWPVRMEQGFSDPARLVGTSLRRDILAGQPVTSDAVMSGLSRHLEPGQRAVAIAIDEVVGGANQMTPGDYVDVFFLLDKKDEISGTQSRLLQSRLKVLTYGDASIDGPSPDEAKANANSNNRGARQAPRTATLAVPLEYVNELFLASRTGRLQLALRSPEDEALVDRSLFAERRPVLAGKTGLTPEQRAELELADNKAYAGDSLVQLSNVVVPAPVVAAPRVSSGGGTGGNAIQIWRAGKPEIMRY